jgi:glyoxylase-like metal-dependent hydrolase (beta-lactamase superfamily II)
VSVRVGEIEVTPLVDAVGRLAELSEVYPEVAAGDWEPYRVLYPDLFAGSEWLLPCTSYLVRSGETTVLVDTGVGPPGLWDWNAEWEGGLPERLEDLGVGRDEIDVVFLTHLHIDHVGWNADEDGAVFFPRARYLVHADGLAFARTQDERPHVQRCIVSLGDRFEPIADGDEVAPGVTAVSLPGHFPGHLGLRASSEGEELLLMGDAAVNPALLDHPEWRYVSDGDHEQCVETRRRVVDELVDADTLVACGHYPGGGIGRIVRRDGAVVWEAR